MSNSDKDNKQLEKFTYKELKELGFKRHQCYDSVFFNNHGYEYFYLARTLLSFTDTTVKGGQLIEIVAQWHPNERTVEVIKTVDDTIVSRLHITSKDRLVTLINFLEAK